MLLQSLLRREFLATIAAFKRFPYRRDQPKMFLERQKMLPVLTSDMRMHVPLDFAALWEPLLAVSSPFAILPGAQKALISFVQLLYVFGVDVVEERLAVLEHQSARLATFLVAPQALLFPLRARPRLRESA